MIDQLDVVVVGAGPNGLAAAVTLAAAGLSVRLYEATATAGGGCRTAELTVPGLLHDVCSAVHPLAVASPFFRSFDLAASGVEVCTPPVAFGQPLGGDRAAVLHGSVAQTAAGLGADGPAYDRLMAPLVRRAEDVVEDLLAPLVGVPAHPAALLPFGRRALPTATRRFAQCLGDQLPALLSGAAAHSMQPLSSLPALPYGLLLTMLGHTTGWPVVRGGSRSLTDALVRRLESLGGQVVTEHRVCSLAELPAARATLLDVSPRQLLALAGDRLPAGYARALERFRPGPGVCKVDYALTGPVPWTADVLRAAGTVHLGGTWREVAAAERRVAQGAHPERPYVLVVQPAAADHTRVVAGLHPLWAYCHVPNGSTVDMTARIDAQIERFAPGFGDLVVARHTRTAVEQEDYDANCLGGDIAGGAATVWQTVFRPVPRLDPYATPLDGVYLCSASTPPGAGVHGMCGLHAARSALRRTFGIRELPDLAPAAPRPPPAGRLT